MIVLRLSDICRCEEKFSKAASEYKKALRKSGSSENINYISQSTAYASNNKKKRERSRIMILFNPPGSAIALPPISGKNFSH